MGELRDQARLTIHNSLYKILATSNDSKFWISVSSQTAVIDVGRPTEHDFIINDHKFRVQVDDFSGRRALLIKLPMVSEAEKLQVLAWVISMREQSLPEAVFRSADSVILPLHFLSQDYALLIFQVSWKARNKWQQYIHPKIFVVLDGLKDPQVKRIGNFVLDSWGISGGGNKELVFNIDEALCLGN